MKRTSLGRVHPVVVHVGGRRGIHEVLLLLVWLFFLKKLKLLISKKKLELI